MWVFGLSGLVRLGFKFMVFENPWGDFQDALCGVIESRHGLLGESENRVDDFQDCFVRRSGFLGSIYFPIIIGNMFC